MAIEPEGVASSGWEEGRWGVLLKRLSVGAAVFLFFALFAGAWFAFLHIEANLSAEPQGTAPKQFSRVLGEEFFIRNPKEPAPRMSCRHCRVEKMRLGHLSLGGLNVLRLEGLVLNIPPEGLSAAPSGDRSGGAEQSAAEKGREEPPDWMSVFSALPMLSGGRQKRFSAVQIGGLAVNRMTAAGLVPVFDADHGANEGRELVLKKCRLFLPDGTNELKTAVLKLGKHPSLKWRHGTFDILTGALR